MNYTDLHVVFRCYFSAHRHCGAKLIFFLSLQLEQQHRFFVITEYKGQKLQYILLDHITYKIIFTSCESELIALGLFWRVQRLTNTEFFSGGKRSLKTSKKKNRYWTRHTFLFFFSPWVAQMFFTGEVVCIGKMHCRRAAHAHTHIKLDVYAWMSVWADPQALNQSQQIVCVWYIPSVTSSVIVQLFNITSKGHWHKCHSLS